MVPRGVIASNIWFEGWGDWARIIPKSPLELKWLSKRDKLKKCF